VEEILNLEIPKTISMHNKKNLLPKISVIMGVYNGSLYLRETIASVLSQSFTDFEFIIVDDYSSDDSLSIIESYDDPRIRLLKNKTNLGIAKTHNICLKIACGEYIANIDHDDVWCDPDKLKKQITFLDTHPNHVLVGTGIICIDQDNNELFRYLNAETDKEIRSLILHRNRFAHSSVVYKKNAAILAGGYPENYTYAEDYALWLTMGLIGKIHNLPSYSLKYRTHLQSAGNKSARRMLQLSAKITSKFIGKYPGNRFIVWLRNWIRLVWFGYMRKRIF